MPTLYYRPRRGGKATKMYPSESPVACPLCDLSDVQSLDLSEHVDDMEAYFCNVCGFVFVRPIVSWADFKRAGHAFHAAGLQNKVNTLRREKGLRMMPERVWL